MRFFLGLVLIVLGVFGMFAQSNDALDQALSQDQLTFGAAAYLGLSAAGLVPETADAETVLSILAEQDWGFGNRSPDEPMYLGDYSHLLMRAFSLPGGLWYSLFPGSRYALREFVYKGIINQPVWPSKTLKGDEAIRILLKVMDLKESLK